MVRYRFIIMSFFLVLTGACSTGKNQLSDDGELGFVTVNSTPWGDVYLDGTLIDSTPVVKHAMKQGNHDLKIERDGFNTHREKIWVSNFNTSIFSIKLTRP